MKKKIIIGLALTASLLYLGISCRKKEDTDSTTPEARLRPQATPTTAGTKITSDRVTAIHDQYYKEQLIAVYHSIFLLNEHLNLSFLDDTIKNLSHEEQSFSNEIRKTLLVNSKFNDKRIKIIDSKSTLYQLLVTPNTNITYRELYYKLSKVIDDVYELKTLVGYYIENINKSQLSQNAKKSIINGTNDDPTKGFIGFQKIFNKYNEIKFLKINKNNEEINKSEWSLEDPSKFTQASEGAEALTTPNIVTIAHSKLYKEQLLTAYRKILEVDNHLKLPFLANIVNKFSTKDHDNYETLLESTLKEKKFETKRIEIINSTSTLYKLLVTANTNMTYQDLYYHLSKISDELNDLKVVVHDFNKLLKQDGLLTANAKNAIIKGTHPDDPTKGFIGFKKISEKYDSIVFKKINSNGSVINHTDWKKE
jgi:hypothetical protein